MPIPPSVSLPHPIEQSADEPDRSPEAQAASEAADAALRALPDAVFDAVETFESLGLRGSVLKSVQEAGFEKPTKIQALLIPPMLRGADVLGQARTGTGKTGAFGLPLLHMCERGVATQALVLVPTRELCLQVSEEINNIGRGTPIRATAVYGGERISKQADALGRKPEIVVSTPGRLMDMVERGLVRLDQVRFAVLDEVDRMLDIGFRDDIRRILGKCPPSMKDGQKLRQTVFVSATISSDIEKLARQYAHQAEKVIAVYTGALTNASVKQYYLAVQKWDKKRLLLHLLTHEEPALTLIFCRMKRTVDELAMGLQKRGIDVHAMHGDMVQNKRNRVIEKLHAGELSVLVASDLAARGLDVEGITHVINFDMPEDPEVYVHRIGRTARVGRAGVAWSFVTPDQGELLTNVENLINTEVPKLDYPDFVPSAPPQGQFYEGPAAAAARPPAQPANMVNRYAATVNPVAPVSSSGPDLTKFPGGLVPSKLPPKRMWGKVKSADALKAALAEQNKPKPNA